jgi:hypothetical protein
MKQGSGKQANFNLVSIAQIRARTLHFLLMYFCLRPFERGSVLIAAGYKSFDGFDQHADDSEPCPLQGATAQDAKPAFNLVIRFIFCVEHCDAFPPPCNIVFICDRVDVVRANRRTFSIRVTRS